MRSSRPHLRLDKFIFFFVGDRIGRREIRPKWNPDDDEDENRFVNMIADS